MSFNYDQYIRGGKLPHIWCPGCTYGIVFKSLLRAVDSLKIPKDDIALVSGIGCASRLPGYVYWNTLHTTHGRALPFATGLKRGRPDKRVLVVSGDGDATAIGGNHFIHACRRNIDITVIVLNNFIYGMTGGQHSPTTPIGHMATTMPFGNVDPTLGRRNKFRSPTDMLLWMKDTALPASAFEKLPPEKTAGKFPTGVLYKREAPEFSETYFAMVERLKKPKEAREE